MPVEVYGWKDVPEAGDIVLEAADESTAQTVVRTRKLKEERDNTVKSIEDMNTKRADQRRLRSRDAIGADSVKESRVFEPQQREIPKFPILLKGNSFVKSDTHPVFLEIFPLFILLNNS